MTTRLAAFGRFGAWTVALSAILPMVHGTQAACEVHEERRLRTVTARFALGDQVMGLTLPAGLHSDSVMLFPEVTGTASSGSSGLFLEIDGERVAAENGAAIHLRATVGERISVTLTDRAGQRLCTWQPAIRVWPARPTPLPNGFFKLRFLSSALASGNEEGMFVNAGDPILLGVGGPVAAGNGEFQIEGMPARILARTSQLVILRDPKPATGLRTIGSQGYTITLPFVQLQLELPRPSEGRYGTLKVRVLGADALRRPGSRSGWPRASLALANLSQDKIRLRCGKSYRLSADFDDFRMIWLKHEAGGAWSGTCEVRYPKGVPVDVDAQLHLLLPGFRLPRPALPKRLPPLPPRVASKKFSSERAGCATQKWRIAAMRFEPMGLQTIYRR